MWTYNQKSGELKRDDEHVGTGYSGHGEGKNNPEMENVMNTGPLPKGLYSIGLSYQSKTKGPVTMRLFPDPTTRLFGRAGFLIHGDSIAKPGTASEGCIILARPIRDILAATTDKHLRVI